MKTETFSRILFLVFLPLLFNSCEGQENGHTEQTQESRTDDTPTGDVNNPVDTTANEAEPPEIIEQQPTEAAQPEVAQIADETAQSDSTKSPPVPRAFLIGQIDITPPIPQKITLKIPPLSKEEVQRFLVIGGQLIVWPTEEIEPAIVVEVPPPTPIEVPTPIETIQPAIVVEVPPPTPIEAKKPQTIVEAPTSTEAEFPYSQLLQDFYKETPPTPVEEPVPQPTIKMAQSTMDTLHLRNPNPNPKNSGKIETANKFHCYQGWGQGWRKVSESDEIFCWLKFRWLLWTPYEKNPTLEYDQESKLEGGTYPQVHGPGSYGASNDE